MIAVPTVDEMLMLTDDQIDYPSLDADLVAQLATQRTEAFIATSALQELARRDRAATSRTAEQILDGEIWDSRLTAYALEIVFSQDPDRGMEHMKRLLDGELEQPILDTMVENVTYERERFRAGSGRPILRALVHKLRDVPSDAFDNPAWAAEVIALDAAP